MDGLEVRFVFKFPCFEIWFVRLKWTEIRLALGFQKSLHLLNAVIYILKWGDECFAYSASRASAPVAETGLDVIKSNEFFQWIRHCVM